MTRSAFIDALLKDVGIKEGTTAHTKIIDTYNNITPLPRGYRMTYYDPWCAAYVSARWFSYMGDSGFPFECSCSAMVEKAKNYSISRTNIQLGSLLLYDWERDDSPDHVGYVVEKKGKVLTVIEGNLRNMVACREISEGDTRIYGTIPLQYDDNEFDEAKKWAVKNGIIKGDGTAESWYKNINREQLAVILYRYSNR